LILEAGSPEEGWHRGVLGIAAAKIAAEFRRPTLLLSHEEERSSGSGRGYGTTPLHQRLAPVAEKWALSFGGHSHAIGISVRREDWEPFREEARSAFASQRDDTEWMTVIEIDTDLAPEEIGEELARSLEKLEPHGMGNPRPTFILRQLAWNGKGKAVGDHGVRFSFGSNGNRIEAVGWTLGRLSRDERVGTFDVAAHLSWDRFIGGPSLTVLDMERVG
jgi:single-stranded-DNA-specific exonuclease